jgi:hypothetical protein
MQIYLCQISTVTFLYNSKLKYLGLCSSSCNCSVADSLLSRLALLLSVGGALLLGLVGGNLSRHLRAFLARYILAYLSRNLGNERKI